VGVLSWLRKYFCSLGLLMIGDLPSRFCNQTSLNLDAGIHAMKTRCVNRAEEYGWKFLRCRSVCDEVDSFLESQPRVLPACGPHQVKVGLRLIFHYSFMPIKDQSPVWKCISTKQPCFCLGFASSGSSLLDSCSMQVPFTIR
jgi:hypothetical protein